MGKKYRKEESYHKEQYDIKPEEKRYCVFMNMFMIRNDLGKVVNMPVLREYLNSSKFFLRYAGVYEGKEIPKGGELSRSSI